MNISENIFSRTLCEEEKITSIQLELSCLIQSFCAQVTDGYMLASIATGGLFGTLAKSCSSKFFISLFSKLPFSSVLAKGSATTFACFVEGWAIQQTPLLLGKESSNEGWQGWIHLSLTVLSMKTLGCLPIQNRFVRHGVQNITLLTLDSVCGIVGLIEESHKSWIEATVSAEIIGCQMTIGGNLLRCAAPNLSRYEATLDLEYQIKSRNKKFEWKQRFPSLFPPSNLQTVATNGMRIPIRSLDLDSNGLNGKGSNIFMVKKGGVHSQNVLGWRNSNDFFENGEKSSETQSRSPAREIQLIVEKFITQERLGKKVIDTYRYCSEERPPHAPPMSVAEYKYEAKKYLEKVGELSEQDIRATLDLGVMHFSSLGRAFFIKDPPPFSDRVTKPSFSEPRNVLSTDKIKQTLKAEFDESPRRKIALVKIPEGISPKNREQVCRTDAAQTALESMILETEAEWNQRNNVTEIKPTKSYMDLQTALGELIAETLKVLQLGHRPACSLGNLNHEGLYQIKNGEVHPKLEIFYRLIELFHKQGKLLRVRGVEVPRILAISFYELYCPELLAMPYYDRASNTFFVEMEVKDFQRACEIPLSEYLRQKLKERKIEHNAFARMAGVEKLRIQSIMAGGVYQLDFPEILSFSRVLRDNLDFFYLLVRKETPDFVRIVSRKTGMVLSEPFSEFEGQSPPRTFKPGKSPFAILLESYKKKWGLKTDVETAEALHIQAVTYKDYLSKQTLPSLPTFYEMCQGAVKHEKVKPANRTEQIRIRREFYFARNPEVRSLRIFNSSKKKFKIDLPLLTDVEWNYNDLRNLTFGNVFESIVKIAEQNGWSLVDIAKETGIKTAMIQDLLVDGMLEINWPFIERLDQFVKSHLAEMYHRTFLAAIANPILFDLADEIVDQHGRVIRPARFDEPFDFQYRYQHRLKSFKGKEYKAKRKSVA